VVLLGAEGMYRTSTGMCASTPAVVSTSCTTETRERCMVTLHTIYIHPVRRPNRPPPRVAHWMPAGSTLVPCRAGTRELATVARDIHAACRQPSTSHGGHPGLCGSGMVL
jgi:hypothetical protein